MNQPCCYFYLDEDNKIAYVGKANGTLKQRISAHSREKKFVECNCKFDIRYQVFDTESDMDIAEKVYIKSLKPYLNVADTSSGFFPKVIVDVNALPKYEFNKENNSKPNSKHEIPLEVRCKNRILGNINRLKHLYSHRNLEFMIFKNKHFKNCPVLAWLIFALKEKEMLHVKIMPHAIVIITEDIKSLSQSEAYGFMLKVEKYVKNTNEDSICSLEKSNEWIKEIGNVCIPEESWEFIKVFSWCLESRVP